MFIHGVKSMKCLRLVSLFISSLLLADIACAQDNSPTQLPVTAIEQIIGATGIIVNSVLQIEIERTDIKPVHGPVKMIFTPAFEINGTLYFQPLANGKAFLNGDFALLEHEVNPFISALLRHGLTFQAFHQQLPMHKQIWYVHYRGEGNPITLATDIKAAINETDTPFPQAQPTNPQTVLNVNRLAAILHGMPIIGNNGVVSIVVFRKNSIHIGDILVNPEAGISSTIEFQPTDNGSNAEVVANFSMTAHEVDKVVKLMLNQFHWFQGCLYNQETNEKPQLYFDHMAKTGDAYLLAQEVREGLDLTDSI